MKQFDLTTIYNKDRPLSWSAISSFEWNKAQWYRKYVLKELPEVTPELEFGKMIDQRVQDDPTFLPELPRYIVSQHEMRIKFNNIPLVGFADQYEVKTRYGNEGHMPRVFIRDVKTGRKPWGQKRADETGQLTMYLFMLYLMDKNIDVGNSELYIDWLPTHIHESKIDFLTFPPQVHTFKTKRTMRELLAFGQRIKDTWSAMEKFAQQEANKEVHNIEEWN